MKAKATRLKNKSFKVLSARQFPESELSEILIGKLPFGTIDSLAEVDLGLPTLPMVIHRCFLISFVLFGPDKCTGGIFGAILQVKAI